MVELAETGAREAARTGSEWRAQYLRLIRRLVRRRVELGVPMTAVAKRVGRSRNTVWNWENGVSHPDGPDLFCWAMMLGVDLGGEG